MLSFYLSIQPADKVKTGLARRSQSVGATPVSILRTTFIRPKLMLTYIGNTYVHEVPIRKYGSSFFTAVSFI